MRDCAFQSNQQTGGNEDKEDEYEYSQPIYTTMTKKGKNYQEKDGMMQVNTQFKVYSRFVQKKRQNQLWINERNMSIKQRALRDSNEN